MKTITLACLGLMVLGLAACDTTPSDPGTNPPAATMAFHPGARYEYNSYTTSPSDGSKNTATERRRVWALSSTAPAVVYGRTNVAVYLDSIFSAGIFALTDSVYLQQESGTNNIYRYASIAPEIDFSGLTGFSFDKSWVREGQLNATTARWLVGEVADTIQMNLSIPGLQGVKLAVTDSAVASATESITIDGNSYQATKTTHRLELSISAIVKLPIIEQNTAIKLKSESINRTTWIVPQLGAIVKEQRDGVVLDVSNGTYGGVTVPGFSLDVPGYVSVMTKVLDPGAQLSTQ